MLPGKEAMALEKNTVSIPAMLLTLGNIALLLGLLYLLFLAAKYLKRKGAEEKPRKADGAEPSLTL